MDRLSPPPHARRRIRAGASLLAVAALSAVLAGCGGGGSTGASTTARSVTSTTTTTTTVAGTTTTTTTTTETKPGIGMPAVTIGDKNYTEQFILGQLYQQALQAQGYTVNITQNIGPSSVVLGSLKNHRLAMYPEYLNVINQSFTHNRRRFATVTDAYNDASTWALNHGLELLKPTPFSDTPGIAVTDYYATQHHLRTLNDLLGVANTILVGGAAQFKTDRSGLHALASNYGVAISPTQFKPLAVGAQYAALDANTVQAAYVTTTDGELTTGDYRVLGDPRNIFGYGNVVPVLTQKAAQEEGPAFAATIDRVDRTLTLSTMRQLNNAVDVSKLTPAAVAQQYLQTHGLLAPLSPSDYQ